MNNIIQVNRHAEDQMHTHLSLKVMTGKNAIDDINTTIHEDIHFLLFSASGIILAFFIIIFETVTS